MKFALYTKVPRRERNDFKLVGGFRPLIALRRFLSIVMPELLIWTPNNLKSVAKNLHFEGRMQKSACCSCCKTTAKTHKRMLIVGADRQISSIYICAYLRVRILLFLVTILWCEHGSV